MEHTGLLPAADAHTIIHQIEKRMAELKTRVRSVNAPTPEEIFMTLGFVKCMTPRQQTELLEGAELVSTEAGQEVTAPPLWKGPTGPGGVDPPGTRGTKVGIWFVSEGAGRSPPHMPCAVGLMDDTPPSGPSSCSATGRAWNMVLLEHPAPPPPPQRDRLLCRWSPLNRRLPHM